MKKIYILGFVFIFLFLLNGCKKTYIVTADDGTKITEYQIEKEKKFNVIPTKEGHTFLYWELNGSQFDMNTVIKSDIKLTAKWEKNKYDVIFDNIGDNDITYLEVEYGQTIKDVAKPTKEDLEFVGWLLNGETFDVNTPIKENIILVASWTEKMYTVSFDTNGGTIINDIKVASGKCIENIDNPTKEHATFTGWLLNDEVFDLKTPIKSDITLKATYQDDYVITIYPDNGEEEIILFAKPNTSIRDAGGLPDLYKEGYRLVDFYQDAEFERKVNNNTKVNNDLSIYVYWEKIYTLEFNVGSGNLEGEIILEYTKSDLQFGDLYLPQPKCENMYFRGWYKTSDFSDTLVYKIKKDEANDYVFYAKWVEAKIENAYVSILGDSISAFEGYIPTGFTPCYVYTRQNGILTANQMWWKILQNEIKFKLGVVNAYAGTCVMKKYGGWSTENTARLEKSTPSNKINPDVMIIYMGNNDALVEGLDINDFETSYKNMLSNIYRIYPDIQLFLTSLSYHTKESQYEIFDKANEVIFKISTEYNLPIIDLREVYKEEGLYDSIHPNIVGMQRIADAAIKEFKEFYNIEA